ncbi:MAG: SUMF1/EgtB/PvdO family nonheme iron enzyme [Verrucomicrobiota bacterium]
MPARNRPHPSIPDHEVLRIIGGGAYGEVWLARGVTGAMRAVKVVWREDFDDERGFEREFEGILKFEPISREHPGFVNILHVGRSADMKSFYYYVMELADDVRCGRDINPIEYEPLTLRADHAAGEQWETSECIAVGIRLAEALDRLHEEGLAHRDVKPANVIFVNGKAKLADIGLVAAGGQRTFVGTEGFVPPEGPGTSAADVYSLGKVLYEIATGKDRMNFPDLPDHIPEGADGKRWLELNRIICEVCDPRVGKRGITTARQLAEALTHIQRGKRRHRRGMGLWLTSCILFGFAATVIWQVALDSGWHLRFSQQPPPIPPPPEKKPEIGWVRVFSTPEGADIYDETGVLIDNTQSKKITARIGEEVMFTLKKKGFRDAVVRATVPVSAVDEPLPLSVQLVIYRPPVRGVVWHDRFGSTYLPVGANHESDAHVTRAQWRGFAATEEGKQQRVEFVEGNESGKEKEIVVCDQAAAIAFCEWNRQEEIKAGLLTEDEEILPLVDKGFTARGMSEAARKAELAPFRMQVRPIPYGEIVVDTTPNGAEVFVDGGLAGRTEDKPLVISKVKPGVVDLLVVREGYKPYSEKIQVAEYGRVYNEVTMAKNQGVVFGKEWENGLGMKFMPVGEELMVAAWETRVRDYALFVRETGRTEPPAPGFEQTAEHPMVNISRQDAKDFSGWLTERERKMERIGWNDAYRLPTDAEWSLFCGIFEIPDKSPAWRDARKPRVFPWGPEYEPNITTGNYADIAAARESSVPTERTFSEYNDGFAFTAPVGSFPPEGKGLFDLSGNVQEWVSDTYSEYDPNSLGVLRGGGWTSHQVDSLLSGTRNAVPPDYRDRMYGFRVVLARIPADSEEPSEP